MPSTGPSYSQREALKVNLDLEWLGFLIYVLMQQTFYLNYFNVNYLHVILNVLHIYFILNYISNMT